MFKSGDRYYNMSKRPQSLHAHEASFMSNDSQDIFMTCGSCHTRLRFNKQQKNRNKWNMGMFLHILIDLNELYDTKCENSIWFDIEFDLIFTFIYITTLFSLNSIHRLYCKRDLRSPNVFCPAIIIHIWCRTILIFPKFTNKPSMEYFEVFECISMKHILLIT